MSFRRRYRAICTDSSAKPTIIGTQITQVELSLRKLAMPSAELRKEQGLSQQALADQPGKAAGISQNALAAEIGISQRMMAYYESPAAHPPANLLPAITRSLGVSIDALLGVETAKRRTKAVDTRMQRRLQQLEKLD